LAYDELWGVSAPIYWLRALSLPFLPWAKPFLPPLGLPDGLLEHLEVWESIHAEAVLEEDTRILTENVPLDERGFLTKQVVIHALQKLAAQIGRHVAIDFERWVRRHFFRHDIKLALGDWRRVLALACRPPNSHRHQITPPSVLIPIMPNIAPLVSSDRSIRLLIEIYEAAPPPPYQMSPSEKLDKCFEATMLSSAAEQAMIIKALQTIAASLNDLERKQVLAWALLQAEAGQPVINPDRLSGDEYLRVEPPGFEMPSILDPAPDEGNLGERASLSFAKLGLD